MDIQYIANIAAIIGAVSILTTLVFVIFEIRVNLRQFRSIKEISLHDVQNQFSFIGANMIMQNLS